LPLILKIEATTSLTSGGVDSNVIVTGSSNGTWGDPGSLYTGGSDISVVKLKSNGVFLSNSFYGASSSDYGQAIDILNEETIYISGTSNLSWGNPIENEVGHTVIKLSDLCGTTSGLSITKTPTENLCSMDNTSSTVTVLDNKYSWDCDNGSVSESCSATRVYTVTPSINANGTITPPTEQSVLYNEAQEFTLNPNSGYKPIIAGTCGGTLIDNIYTTNNITTDCTVSVDFNAIPIPIPTFTSDSNTSLTVNLDASSSSDSDGTITNYSWTVDGQTLSGVNPSVTLSRTGFHLISLTVTDDKGTQATYSDSITILHPDNKFTKISSTGQELPDSANDWSCVKNNITGQTWEVKTTDNKNDTYIWAESGPDFTTHSSQVNNNTLCGFSDWRVPNIKELNSIIDNTKTNPSINTLYFPNSTSNNYWSNSSRFSPSTYAWSGNFYDGYTRTNSKSSSSNIRLVRGNQYFNFFNYTKLDADGNDLPNTSTNWSCVRDNINGMIWEVKTTNNYNSTYTFNNKNSHITDINNNNLRFDLDLCCHYCLMRQQQ